MMKVPGYEGREIIDNRTFIRELEAASPAVARALADRFATGKVYQFQTVLELWPDLDVRLRKDGSHAQVSGLSARAKSRGFEMHGKPIRAKGRAEVPGIDELAD
jgi:hypothetical protein